ncbi:MAG: Gfo/Idh/MocA family oxidoreductase [Planctomycetes bacterium]|nr:Gfo/Idh/MocA family oxidoreductase [Planctomycetota bacterium]
MSSGQDVIDVAVVGVGRMGRHHARTYKKIAGARLVAVVDADAERAGAVADEYGCESFGTVDEMLAKFPDVRAVSVAVPTAYHLRAATPLLSRGIACLVEKPMAPTVAEAKALADEATRHGAILQIGHTERFNPAVRAVVGMNIRPRFMEVHRVSTMTFRSLDVGVVMDMMIHDLDIVLTLAGSPLARVDAAGVAVLGEHEDVANARLVFQNGCVANLTASRLALKTERKLRVFSEDAYVSLDYQKRNGVVIHRAANSDALDEVRRQLESGEDLSSLDYSRLVSVEELNMAAAPGEAEDWRNDPLTAELTSFIDAVRRGVTPEVDAQAGFAAVDAAERVVAAIRAHRWEGLEKARV